MAEGKMPVLPANLRKYEYDTIRKNLSEAKVTTARWAAEKTDAAKKLKTNWDN